MNSPAARNLSSVALSNGIYAVCMWGVIALFARLGSPASVGMYSIGAAISAPVSLFLGMRLREVYITDFREPSRFPHYLGLRVVSAVIVVVISLTAALLLGYDRLTVMAVLAVAVDKSILLLEDMVQGIFQKAERMHYIAVASILRGLSAVTIVFVVMSFTKSVVLSVLGYSLVWLGIFLIYDVKKCAMFGRCVPEFDFSEISAVIKNAIPLGVVSLLIITNERIGHIMLSKYKGIEDVGFYSAISYAIDAARLGIAAIGVTFMPTLARLYVKDRMGFLALIRKLIWGVVFLSLALNGFIVVWGKKFLAIAYGAEYLAHFSVFVLFGVFSVFVFCGSILFYAMTSMGIFRIQIPIFLAALLANATVGAILIPRINQEGAAIALGASAIIQTILLLIVYIMNIHPARQK